MPRHRPPARHPRRRRSTATTARSSSPTGRGSRTTYSSSPPAASRRSRPSAASSGWTVGSTSGCTRSGALTDCLRLDAAVPRRRRRAVVVGGGLLGLQVARALGVRGLAAEVVEGGDHLLRSQVDAKAGAILARDLNRLGAAVYTGARATRLTDDGLVLDNGFTLDTDLVVLTAGGRPSTALARRAGLEVRRGVVVDHLLRTSDPAIHAIGDCAQHGSQVTGFVPPAWEQAGAARPPPERRAGPVRRRPHRRPAPRHRAGRRGARRPGADHRRGGRGDQPDRRLAPQARRPRRRDRRRHPGRRPVPDRPDHAVLRPRQHPRPQRARLAADGRPEAAADRAARRGGDLRLRRCQRRPDPRLRLARRGPRHHPRHHRLRRLRRAVRSLPRSSLEGVPA